MLRIRKLPGPVTFASLATADTRPGVNVQASEDDVCTAGRLARARSMVNNSTSAAPAQADSEGRVLSHARRPPRASDPAEANNAEWLIDWAICCASSEGTPHPSANMRGPVSVTRIPASAANSAAATHQTIVSRRSSRSTSTPLAASIASAKVANPMNFSGYLKADQSGIHSYKNS